MLFWPRNWGGEKSETRLFTKIFKSDLCKGFREFTFDARHEFLNIEIVNAVNKLSSLIKDNANSQFVDDGQCVTTEE